jgi:hypothetical protein
MYASASASSETSEDPGRMRSHFEAPLCIQSETIPAEVSLFVKETRKGIKSPWETSQFFSSRIFEPEVC